MKITKLVCPNCGAPINKKTTKCEYCGTSFVLENNTNSMLKDTTSITIAKKGISLEFGSRNYSIKSDCEANAADKKVDGRPQKFIAALLIGILIASVLAGIMVGIARATDNEYAEAFHSGEFVCPVCGSSDTEGYHTFWTNDGMPCKAKELADYTLISCNHCGHGWRHYL